MSGYAVIGGGFLGMTLALRLAQGGERVTLFEAAPALGGLAAAWRLGDIVWDRHYHVILRSDADLRRLLGELGLEGEISWVETKTGFYTEGRLHSMSNTWEFLRFPPLSLWDKVRLGATILYASRIRDWQRLESITVERWLRRWSGQRTFEKIWRPLLRAKLGEAYRETSAAFIWATIARMYAARRRGFKREEFGYVPGGYARILERFEEVLREWGVRLELGVPVAGVFPRVGGGLRVERADRPPEHFDRVVVTVPAPVAARLCPALSPAERSALAEISYVGIVCASLLVERPLSPYYVTNITEGWVPFTAVIETTALVDRRAFGGASLLYLPKYVAVEDPLFTASDAEIGERFLSALERLYPHFRRDDLLAMRISRVRHVFALPTIGYSRRLPPVVTSVSGLSIVNAAHIVNGTLNVNETVRLAEGMAGRLLEGKGIA